MNSAPQRIQPTNSQSIIFTLINLGWLFLVGVQLYGIWYASQPNPAGDLGTGIVAAVVILWGPYTTLLTVLLTLFFDRFLITNIRRGHSLAFRLWAIGAAIIPGLIIVSWLFSILNDRFHFA